MKQNHITEEAIRKIAELAQIELTSAELTKFADELASLLTYVEKVGEADTDDVEFTTHVDITNVFRDDVVTSSLSSGEAIGQANHENGYIVVPKVID